MTKQPKKRKWYSLYDKVYNPKKLADAWKQIKRNRGSGGVDQVSIKQFEANLERNLQDIAHLLKTKQYRPLPVKRVYIPKANGKTRPLGIPTIRDRIVQQALRNVLEPVFEPEFSDASFGFRPKKSAHQAITKIEEHLQSGYTRVVDADIEDFFGNVNHNLLLNAVNEQVSDGSILKLIKMFLKAGVMEDGRVRSVTQGTPQGGVISPLLANIYLSDFDQALTARGYKLVRYADDFVILAKNERKARKALQVADNLLQEKQLSLNKEKTSVVNWNKESFEFLGFWFKNLWGTPRKGPKRKALATFKGKVKILTRRQQPKNLKMVIEKLNPVVRGWGNYFKHGDTVRLFGELDGYIRMRLRSFVKKKRWTSIAASTEYPNQRLANLGLVSLLSLKKRAS